MQAYCRNVNPISVAPYSEAYLVGPIKPTQNYNLAITHSIHSFSFFHADQQYKNIGLCQIVTYRMSHWLQSPGLKMLHTLLFVSQAFYGQGTFTPTRR